MSNTRVLLGVLAIGCVAVNTDPELWTKGNPDQCLKTKFHKDAPSPESKDFKACRSWQNSGCCRANISHDIHHNGAKNLYNYHWDKCGPLSDRCELFIKHEECFYQCEPMLWYFKKAGSDKYIEDVPICKHYCEAWFDACKDDMTCVKDWLADFHYDDNNLNHCPVNSTCVTFTEIYGNAQGLCDQMWGDAFHHAPEGTKCMVMAFDPQSASNEFGKGFYDPSIDISTANQFRAGVWLLVAASSVTLMY